MVSMMSGMMLNSQGEILASSQIHQNNEVKNTTRDTVKVGKAEVTFIDDTTGALLYVETVIGPVGNQCDYLAVYPINAYMAQGYRLVSNDFPDDGIVYTEKTQQYTVHLEHAVTVIDPEHPQVPGEPINPEYPEGVKWPEGVDEQGLTDTVKETIHYLYDDGSIAAPNQVNEIKFTHQMTIDNVTGAIVQDQGWQGQPQDSFGAVQSPDIPGYTPDYTQIDTIQHVKHDSEDIDKTIIYSKPVDNNHQTDTKPTVSEKEQVVQFKHAGEQETSNPVALPQTGQDNHWQTSIYLLLSLVMSLAIVWIMPWLKKSK